MPSTKVVPGYGNPGTVAGNPTGTWGTQPGGTPTVPAVGASPVTFTNATANMQALYVTGVAGTQFTLTKRGVILGTNLDAAADTSVMVAFLAPGESVILTYGGAAPVVVIDTP